MSRFLSDTEESILGRLTDQCARAGYFQQVHAQTAAWRAQIALLKECAGRLLTRPEFEAWQILFEYPIPRRGKRIDVVLLTRTVIIVLEFKIGGRAYDREAIAQVEDYALDLRDFHRESRHRPIVPILVATAAPAVGPPDGPEDDWVRPTWRANIHDLTAKLSTCLDRHRVPTTPAIDPALWDAGEYAPTPTIIEAARALYAGQNVREISRCHAGAENLTRTSNAVIAAIEQARAEGRKRICFVTGIPGAGKTLAGLNVVHNRGLHERDLGVFLSGNGPLVRVLTEALARDAAVRTKRGVPEARREVKTFVQNVHHFLDAYYAEPGKVPVDRIVIFDEAQRAWDDDQSMRKFGRPFSEPEILLEIMDRHPAWSVVVALVGSGQEINRGEAGLPEWGRALRDRFPHWDVLIAPGPGVALDGTVSGLSSASAGDLRVIAEPALHLGVNLRSYKAEALSQFVDALLRRDPGAARSLMPQLGDFPLVMTRDLSEAKAWLRRQRRGSRRIGLVASSGARRLRAHGLDVTADLDVENWFLNGADDVRSSHALEVPATEFGIQGLELDWTGICWGEDLYPTPDGWAYQRFRGTRWERVNDAVAQQFIVNKYRVLLTRAREGMVIWVPPGDPTDPTRPPAIHDSIAAYLSQCGIPPTTTAGSSLQR